MGATLSLSSNERTERHSKARKGIKNSSEDAVKAATLSQRVLCVRSLFKRVHGTTSTVSAAVRVVGFGVAHSFHSLNALTNELRRRLDCGVAPCLLCLGQNVTLEHTARTTAGRQQAHMFCAYATGNTSQRTY